MVNTLQKIHHKGLKLVMLTHYKTSNKGVVWCIKKDRDHQQKGLFVSIEEKLLMEWYPQQKKKARGLDLERRDIPFSINTKKQGRGKGQ